MSRKVTSKLLKMPKSVAFLAGTTLILSFLVTTGSATTPVVARQDKETSSRRESEAIKAVESAGGRVYRISAADTTREVSFNLVSVPVGDQQLKDVNVIGEVIWMNLAGTNVTNDGLKHLAGLPLKKLHLERTKIGDDGLKHLKSFKDLEYLNVYDTKVTDAGLEHLKELKNLRKLYVWKSSVTEAGMKKLNESLPELAIVGELKLEPVVIEEPKKEEPPKTEKGKKEKPKKADDKKAKRKKKAAESDDQKAKSEDKQKDSTNPDKKKADEKDKT